MSLVGVDTAAANMKFVEELEGRASSPCHNVSFVALAICSRHMQLQSLVAGHYSARLAVPSSSIFSYSTVPPGIPMGLPPEIPLGLPPEIPMGLPPLRFCALSRLLMSVALGGHDSSYTPCSFTIRLLHEHIFVLTNGRKEFSFSRRSVKFVCILGQPLQ